MPEFERLDPPASGGSGGKHKPKFDKKQKMLLLGGGIAVVLVALFMNKAKHSGGSSQEAVEEELKDYYTNYPTLGSQNAVVQDGMNTLVGRQEELLNSILELQGKKDPAELTKIYVTFDNSDEALKRQQYLINSGASTTYVRKQFIKDGWAGAKDYYVVEAYGKDRQEMADLVKKGVQDKQWGGMEVGKVKTGDAPSYGAHSRSY
ncbi:hypothetical protein P4U03_17735 [Bacillus mycoides]|uniref:Uncharacterized protein n=13 Tax=root TaxID=1 RepID=Q5ILA6_9VIRU|nr:MULTISPECIES: hypothetical protein [Bacillales]YP_224124.1 hypothetical protein GIL16c_gp26 [Bacillus phage GIL16c]MEB4843983.1 hypothetical protein [Paenibacillus jamilae]MEC0301325.1 hypothetical protein [Peribacillus castrilensis]MEC0304912.1 hypothetical protein [Terribacillus saccharophilus]AAW33589.1 hypothetical protein [Bacillus phage GIL16c]AIE37891.1 hypothetical protein BTK_35026 [Bacillus thuringiensis serovar kurstaki str. HD-1]